MFAKVDLQLARSTVKTYKSSLNVFFSRVRKPITEDSIRRVLYDYSEEYPNKSTYAAMLKATKSFFKKYLKSNITDSFRYPKIPYHPKKVPTKKQLQEFYRALTSLKKKALFLLYASSGLRRSEILFMRMEDVDLDRRMIIPTIHTRSTKRSWILFFN